MSSTVVASSLRQWSVMVAMPCATRVLLPGTTPTSFGRTIAHRSRAYPTSLSVSSTRTQLANQSQCVCPHLSRQTRPLLVHVWLPCKFACVCVSLLIPSLLASLLICACVGLAPLLACFFARTFACSLRLLRVLLCSFFGMARSAS